MPIISIIVPIFKAEAYLHRCVNSILAQTFDDFEVLLIDDGSPDGSGAICDVYAAKDSRVKVFHKTNGGVSDARQFGMDHATGEYTIHADPDDWVEPTMLEALYHKAIEADADMVIADFFVNDSQYCKQTVIVSTAKAVLHDLLFQQLHGSCWNKLVKRACYNRYNVKFLKGLNYSEDLLVNVQLLVHNDIRVAYLPQAFYHYDMVVNTNSISRKYTRNTYEQRCLFLKELKLYTPDYLLTQRSIISEAILSGVLSRKEFYSVYTADLRAMYDCGRFKDFRDRLSMWLLKGYMFNAARIVMNINNFLVKIHLKIKAR